MEITKNNQDSFLLVAKQADVAINPDKEVKADVVLQSGLEHTYKPTKEQILFDGPGEYEVKNTMIDAVALQKTTGFVVTSSGLRISFIDTDENNLDESQIEALGNPDILIIRAFGEKAESLNKLISELEPSIVIPFGYNEAQLKSLSAEFGKGITRNPKLKVSKKDVSIENQQLIVLE